MGKTGEQAEKDEAEQRQMSNSLIDKQYKIDNKTEGQPLETYLNMYRKHMTEEQARKLKMAQLNAVHTGIRVEQLYPQVEKIEIHHVRTHTSFAGRSQQEGTWVVTSQSEVCFVLSCLNRECTSIGFDLGSVISSAIHCHKTEVSGEMDCEGQEAPDHPEQSCDERLKYTIKIIYK